MAGRHSLVDTASKLQAFREEMKWLDLELDRLRPPPGETLCEECFVILDSAVFMLLHAIIINLRAGEFLTKIFVSTAGPCQGIKARGANC